MQASQFEVPNVRLALIFTLLLIPAAAMAQPVEQVTWRDLAANPQRYIGHRVELAAAYCSDYWQPGFRCSTDGAVYVEASALTPDSERTKVDDQCGGLDVIERSSFCRARIRFIPRSFRTTTDFEGEKKSVQVFVTDTVDLSFQGTP
jgi:hypothetical protein